MSSGHARPRARDPIRIHEPDAHRIDEAVVAVRLVEDRLAADGRDADAVAVMADPCDGAPKLPAVVGEAQTVQDRDRARSHRDDVSQDSPDARGCALERLHRGRVVVRLDLERDRLAVADIDHARVLTRPQQNAFPTGGKPFQQKGRMLVAAVFRPEKREHRELEVVRVAVEQPADAVELLVGQPQRTVERLFRRDLRQGIECSGGRRWAGATLDPS